MVAEAFLPTVGVDEIELINRPTSLIFGIIFTVRTGTLWPHSFATKTAAECAVRVGRFMLKQTFRDFVFSTNTDGSGKAASYARVLDMLGPILAQHYTCPVVNGSMWLKTNGNGENSR